MTEWEMREQALLEKETAYLKDYNTFQRIVDSHLGFCIALVAMAPVAVGLGLLIGLLISR